MYKWNDKNLEKRYKRIERDTLNCPNYEATEDTVKTPTLESWKFKTNSARIWGMIQLAYNLGRMQSLRDIDEGQNQVTQQAQSNRYGFLFEYGCDFMIVLYESENDYKYFNSSENDYDKSVEYMKLFLQNDTLYHYKANSLYDTIYNNNIEIFELANQPIDCLEQYRVNK